MIRIKKILVLFFGALLMAACTKEELNTQTYDGATSQMNIGITKSVGNSTLGVKTIRVIVFSRGKIVSNTLKDLEASDPAKVQATVALGENNFYVFCNETPELTTKLESALYENTIEDISFELAAATNLTFIPIYGKVLGAEVVLNPNLTCSAIINGTTYTEVEVPSTRLMAKLGLEFIKNTPDTDTDFTVEEISVYIHQMPKVTNIKAAKPYTSLDWSDNFEVTSPDMLITNGTYTINSGAYSVGAGIDKVVFPEIFIPEHILENLNDATKATYLAIKTICRYKVSGVQFTSNYIVPLGVNPPSNHNVERNNQYNIYATIIKPSEGITAIIKQVPWIDGGTIDVVEPDDVIRYLNVSELSYNIDIYGSDINKLITKQLYFWTNQPYDKISLGSVVTTYYDYAGYSYASVDDYYNYLQENYPYIVGMLTKQEVVPAIGVTMTKNAEQIDNNSGYVDFAVNLPIFGRLARTETTFYIKAGNLNRKITIKAVTHEPL